MIFFVDNNKEIMQLKEQISDKIRLLDAYQKRNKNLSTIVREYEITSDVQLRRILELERMVKTLSEISLSPIIKKDYPKGLIKSACYRGNYLIKTKSSDIYSVFDKAQYYFQFGPYLEKYLGNLDGSEVSILAVANEILGNVQIGLTYIYDDSQWGKSEVWSDSKTTSITKTEDCESLSNIVVDAFNYYKFKYNKFKESEMFLGVGLFAKQYGHGFPVLVTDMAQFDKLGTTWYIGEATLNSRNPFRKLYETKDMYWVNWGLESWNFEGKLETKLQWWNSTGVGNVKKITDKPKLSSNERKTKKELIDLFWGNK